MLCKNCKTELPSKAKFCPECATPVPKQTGLRVNQEVDTVKGDVTGLAAADGATTAGLDADIGQDIGTVESGGTVVGAAIGGPGGDVHVGGQQHYGDVVHGDQISVSDVRGKTVAIAAGRESRAEAKTGLEAEGLARLFADIYQQIEQRPQDPDVEKDEITETVEKIEQEAAKGEKANPNRVERWLKTLAMMAPDILEVTTACLLNPAAGVATVIKLVAQKAQAEAAMT